MMTAEWNPLVPSAERGASQAGQEPRRLRIGILSFSTAEYDSRSHRIARSAVQAGHEVTIYARWKRGLSRDETIDGYRIVRRAAPLRLLIPGIGHMGGSGKRSPRAQASSKAASGPGSGARAANGAGTKPGVRRGRRSWRDGRLAPVLSPVARVARPIRRTVRRSSRRALAWVQPFPLKPMAWARSLDGVAEPADIWHGMWATSLPALERLRSQHGGRTIYDCRDILLRSRAYERMPRRVHAVLARYERKLARATDQVITVNEPYAEIVTRLFDIEPPPIVMNCPERWERPAEGTDLIRQRLNLPAMTGIVLYQGGLKTDRGIEECMDAILQVPDAALVLLGFGPGRRHYQELSESDRFRGRVHVLDAVPPQELLPWTASADVMVMAIQASSLNHRYTTPQKLFEAIAAGVPVVASDLPGMASIVTATGCGELCDPASPTSIADAIRRILQAPPDVRAEYARRASESARATYNWEAQLVVLGTVYGKLAAA
jgi:glycosyltransferase involved in cell wall biosynthesis